MESKQLAKKILDLIGGEKNIVSYTNCMTRLRFKLKNYALVKTKELEKLEDVMGTQLHNGQFQVILGGKVVKVANAFSELVKVTNNKLPEKQNKNLFSRILDTLSAIIAPALPPIIAGGMLKGILFILSNYQIVSDSSDTILFLNVVSDVTFYFFPFILAVSSARRFKTNEFLALVIAGTMMYPVTVAEGQTMLYLFGFLPVAVVDYSSSVLPIIFSVYLLKYVYDFFNRIIPDMLLMILSPLLTLLVTLPITMSVLAPLGFYIGEYIAIGIKWLIEISPWLTGFIFGLIKPIMTLGGMHHAITPMMQQEIATFGESQLLAMDLMSTMAQAAAPVAIYFLTKSKTEKQVCASSAVSGFIGITEPALYGVLTKYKSAMLAASIGGGIGCAVCMSFHGVSYGFAMPSIFTLPVFAGPGFIGIIIGLIISIGLTIFLTFIFQISSNKTKLDSEVKKEKDVLTNEVIKIFSPTSGDNIPLSEINDETFSKEILGKTIAIKSEDGCIYAPFNGTVKMLFDSNHAIGLMSDDNVELLIHIGIDTVQLQGKGFISHVKQGDRITKGQLLIEFDEGYLKSQSIDDTVIVVLTNSDVLNTVEVDASPKILNEQTLFVVQRDVDQPVITKQTKGKVD